MCGSKQLLGAYGSVARGLFAWNSLRRAGSRALRASCELQEVVHSVLTGNADVAKPQRLGGGPNVSRFDGAQDEAPLSSSRPPPLTCCLHDGTESTATPHRRHGMVDQEISQHRAAEGSDERFRTSSRCHHRVSPGRAPLSQNRKCERFWTLPCHAEARSTRPEGHVATGSLSRGQSYLGPRIACR